MTLRLNVYRSRPIVKLSWIDCGGRPILSALLVALSIALSPSVSQSQPAGYDFVPPSVGQADPEIEFSHSVSADGARGRGDPDRTTTRPARCPARIIFHLFESRWKWSARSRWKISGLSSITTCRQSPAIDPSFGGQYPDRFCLDGQRLVSAVLALDGGRLTSAPGTEYRSEINPYTKIIAHGPRDYPDAFEAFAPDGLIYRYGSRAGSSARLEGHVVSCTWGQKGLDQHDGCVDGPLQRRAWMLDEIEDRIPEQSRNRLRSSRAPASRRNTIHLSCTSTHSGVAFSGLSSRNEENHFRVRNQTGRTPAVRRRHRLHGGQAPSLRHRLRSPWTLAFGLSADGRFA